ncbi:hypothetical protein JCM5296_004828 [Sporobolomyces johnsonii]
MQALPYEGPDLHILELSGISAEEPIDSAAIGANVGDEVEIKAAVRDLSPSEFYPYFALVNSTLRVAIPPNPAFAAAFASPQPQVAAALGLSSPVPSPLAGRDPPTLLAAATEAEANNNGVSSPRELSVPLTKAIIRREEKLHWTQDDSGDILVFNVRRGDVCADDSDEALVSSLSRQLEIPEADVQRVEVSLNGRGDSRERIALRVKLYPSSPVRAEQSQKLRAIRMKSRLERK